jgi:predicted RNA methylase
MALNNLRKQHVIGPSTICIPYRYQCAFNLINYDFSFYGFHMPFVIQARNFAVMKRVVSSLSPTVIASDINLQKPISTQVNETIAVPVEKTGTCNALVLKARTFLAPGISYWGTTDMNMPVIIPMKPKKLYKGKQQRVHIRYTMGMGFQSFTARFV